MPLIDLDAARAARREKAGDPVRFRFAGETFEFPLELPLASDTVVQEAREDKWSDERFLRAWLQAVLGDSFDRLIVLGVTREDLGELFDQAMRHFKTSMGESAPSASSSRRAGGSSKRSSRRSTAKTPATTSSTAASAG